MKALLSIPVFVIFTTIFSCESQQSNFNSEKLHTVEETIKIEAIDTIKQIKITDSLVKQINTYSKNTQGFNKKLDHKSSSCGALSGFLNRDSQLLILNIFVRGEDSSYEKIAYYSSDSLIYVSEKFHFYNLINGLYDNNAVLIRTNNYYIYRDNVLYITSKVSQKASDSTLYLPFPNGIVEVVNPCKLELLQN